VQNTRMSAAAAPAAALSHASMLTAPMAADFTRSPSTRADHGT
jgi:hypothetical protein